MARAVALAAAAALVAVLAGSARANTFAVLTEPPGYLTPPSAEVPNLPGSLVLPPGWETATTVERVLTLPELSGLWRRAGAAYGIPWNVLAAINKIESNFGRNMGPSSAGAVGWMQFMPDTWRRWGTDGDGDGIADPWNPYDAILAAARYLAAAGGRTDLSRAIFAYNHADWYVRQVLDLARLYGGAAAGDVAFQLDRLQVSLDEAQARVADLGERVAVLELRRKALARREATLLKRADAASSLSDALALRKRAGQVGVRLDAVRSRLQALRGELRQARRDLEAARSTTRGAAFTIAGRALFGTPSFSGSYVFPVGGGPSVVSVAHDHHDYPAADIAAPMGSPLYALTGGIVRNAWPTSRGKCGIGFIFDGDDGQTWTYCHLSYLEPSVHTGALLAAGQSVGLVGSTGNSTGPHLHLGLTPLSYPQEQAWFQSFAGTAFRWQDAPTPERFLAISIGPVFTVERPAAVFAVVEGDTSDDAPVLFTRLGG